MGARFLTEKQIEANLTEEVRTLPLLDGSTIVVRGYTVNWRNFDIVVKHGVASAAEIAEAIEYQAEVQGVLPGQALGGVLIPLRTQANRIIDDKLAALEKRMAMREKLIGEFRNAVRPKDEPRPSE
jgi:hypothetical protein